MKARIIGVSAQMNTFAFLFGAMLSELLLRHSDDISQTLQHANIRRTKSCYMVVRTLEMIKDDANFDMF